MMGNPRKIEYNIVAAVDSCGVLMDGQLSRRGCSMFMSHKTLNDDVIDQQRSLDVFACT